MFHYYSVFSFENFSEDETLEALMMAEVDFEDIQSEDGITTVYGKSDDFNEIKEAPLAKTTNVNIYFFW